MKPNPNDEIEKIMQSMTDSDIKKLINDFTSLKNIGILPIISPFRDLVIRICKIYNVDYDLRMGESWLQTEVFRRFLLKV